MEKRYNVKILKDFPGAEDGFTIQMYKKDAVYNVGESFARLLVNGKLALLVKPKKAAAPKKTVAKRTVKKTVKKED
jgi:hypothetical protein